MLTEQDMVRIDNEVTRQRNDVGWYHSVVYYRVLSYIIDTIVYPRSLTTSPVELTARAENVYSQYVKWKVSKSKS